MKNLNILMFLFCILLLGEQAMADKFDKEVSKKSSALEDLEESLKSNNLRERSETAKRIAESEELATEMKAKLIFKALREEHLSPQSNEVETWTGYTTVSEYLKTEYMLALKNIGSSVIPVLKENYKMEAGEMKEKIAVVLGYLGDSEVHSDLVKIIRETKNPFTKAQAIRAMYQSGIGGKEMISIYKRALKDKFYVVIKNDLIAPSEREHKILHYPVRESAFTALKKLGVKIKRDKTEFVVEEE